MAMVAPFKFAGLVIVLTVAALVTRSWPFGRTDTMGVTLNIPLAASGD